MRQVKQKNNYWTRDYRKVRSPIVEPTTKQTGKRTKWKEMSREQIIDRVKFLIKLHGIASREDLLKKASGAYKAAKNEGIFDEVGLLKKTGSCRSWTEIDDDKIVAMAQKKIDDEKLASISKLRYLDGGIYTELWERGLLDRLKVPNASKTANTWIGLGKTELLKQAKKIIKDEHIRSRTELQQKYGSLYNALTDQQLVNKLGIPSKRANHRNWRKLTDKQIVDAANSKTKQLKIKNKTQFLKADNGLADAIMRRKLLDKIVFWKEPSSQVDLQAQ